MKIEYPSWLRVDPETLNLADIEPRDKRGPDGDKMDRDDAEAVHEKNLEAVRSLQWSLYAESKRGLLVVLQALDTGGKDGTIRRVFGPINPQGCRVASFGRPTEEELAHDYLWRVHRHTPAKGMIQIFNRSHYEDVLVVRVHNLVPESVWSKRYAHIRDFERLLSDNDTAILKFFLHISKDEQKERLQERLDDPTRHWKFDPRDLEERKLWDDYQEAYRVALTETSTEFAPWYVIPADRKWFRNFAISTIVRQTLESMDLQLPEAPELDGIVVE